ncbi:poils au dos [Haematobia irritans]|uniref:poils au dos n=1 Tax=Haematobia irritans TaxID=7368 RepID=UPI003F4F9A9F
MSNNMLKSVNFYDLCRICTTTASTGKTDIFSQEGKSKNLNGKIMECLSITIEETDRLPKVVCQQCVNLLENFTEFRNICRNSQTMLNSCLDSSQNGSGGGRVVIKDVITSTGKSASVLSNVSNSMAVQQQTMPINVAQPQQVQIQQPSIFSLQGSNLIAMPTTPTVQNQDFLNSVMQLGLQPDSVVKTEKPSLPQYTITMDNSNQQQLVQTQICSEPSKEKETKSNALEEFLKLKPNIKVTPIPKRTQPNQMEMLPQDQLVQLQLQQLQQQLQLLTSQLQPQQITITAPPLQAPLASQTSPNTSIPATENTTISSSDIEDSSPSKNKKPKLNFVLAPPAPTPTNTATTLSATIPQLVNSPQIQFQLQPALQQPNSAATLLSNLAPLLQPQTQNLNALLQSQSITQNTPSYLPITIKDENTDQQYVAHIDAKNFLLPTYQLQMKLQPQITGQQIMQFAPTLQLTPNPSYQPSAINSLNTNISSLSGTTQSLPIQIANTPLPQALTTSKPQMTAATTNQQQQSNDNNTQRLKQTSSGKNIEITSQQIINPGKIKQEPLDTVEKPNKTEIGDSTNRPKYKISQSSSGGNTIEITPTTSFTQKIMQQVQEQQQQKISPTTLAQHGGITVQRINPKSNQVTTNATKEAPIHSTKPSNTTPTNLPKLPILNKGNITISRVTSLNPQSQKTTNTSNQNPTPQTQTANVKIVSRQQTLRSSSIPATQQKITQSPNTTAIKQQNSGQSQKPQIISNVSANVTSLNISPTKKIIKKIQKPSESESDGNVIKENQTTSMSSNVAQAESGAKCSSNENNVPSTDSSQSNAQNSIECSQCGRGFKKKEHLTQHLKLHTGIRPFRCNEEGCTKAFHRKEHLLRHHVSHSGKKMFSCDICQKPFSRKDNLSKHRKIHTEANTNSYECEICNKTFVVKTYYIQHKLLHKTKSLPPPDEDPKSETQQEADNQTNESSCEKTTQNQTDYQNQHQLLQQQEQLQKQQQQQQQTLQLVQQQLQQLQGQPQIMQLQLPTSMVTTQNGNTITIQASNDPNANSFKSHETTVLNLPATSLANFVQLSQAQFVNPATGQIMGHLKMEK